MAPIQSGILCIDPSTYEAFLDKKLLPLTSTEFRLLHILARNRRKVMQHQALEQHIWGDNQVEPDTLKKYIHRLRRKLDDDSQAPHWIASVHGVGYRFVGPDPSQAAERTAV